MMLLLAALTVFLGRTSRVHLVFLELLLVGGFGAMATSYTELRDYNVEFDRSEPKMVEATVTRHYTVRCGKNGHNTCYHVDLQAGGELNQSLSLKLNYATWNTLSPNANVHLPLHAGALGLRWIDEPQLILTPPPGRPPQIGR